MSTQNLRVVVRLVVLFALVFALSLTGWASSLTNIGSSSTSRSNVDTASGEVYIYNGGFFTPGETVNTFNWFGPTFAGNGNFTPLLFSVSGGVYTVVGIGDSQDNLDSGIGSQSVGFGLQAGSNVAGSQWTFGFIEADVNSNGDVSGQTTGAIPFNVPTDGGTGVQGSGTNDWLYTHGSVNVDNVDLGTTFSQSNGSTFRLASGVGAGNLDRTYSANADGLLSGVAEPGTFSLITGAGLVLAGLFRYRYVRGRRD